MPSLQTRAQAGAQGGELTSGDSWLETQELGLVCVITKLPVSRVPWKRVPVSQTCTPRGMGGSWKSRHMTSQLAGLQLSSLTARNVFE